MDAQIQAQLDRVEAALNTLIDSITSYNPSPAAAIALSNADDDLTQGLEQLTRHQSNYALLLSLRAKSTALDTRIKSTLTQLAATRTELLTSTPVTLPPKPRSPSPSTTTTAVARTDTVDYADLLSYAARIAKFTVPPTYRPPLPPPIDDTTNTDAAPAINSTGVAASLAPAGDTTAVAAASNEAPKQATTTTTATAPTIALTSAQQAWLDPSSTSLPFTPWPRDEYIRRGALAQIQAARDRGVSAVDLESADLTGGSVEIDAEVQELEGVETKDEGRVSEEEEEEAARKGLGGGLAAVQRPRRREEPAKEEVFEGFELYNPDEM